MSVSFNTSLGSMENELMKLILDGSIQVRRGEDRISTQIECFAPEPEFWEMVCTLKWISIWKIGFFRSIVAIWTILEQLYSEMTAELPFSFRSTLQCTCAVCWKGNMSFIVEENKRKGGFVERRLSAPLFANVWWSLPGSISYMGKSLFFPFYKTFFRQHFLYFFHIVNCVFR